MMPITRTDRNQTFRDGVLIAEELVEVDITAEVNESDLHAKARQAVADNIASIAVIPGAVAKVQGVIDGTAANLSQANAALDELAVVLKGLLNDYERMLRQLVAVERLIIGSDLLDDTTGT